MLACASGPGLPGCCFSLSRVHCRPGPVAQNSGGRCVLTAQRRDGDNAEPVETGKNLLTLDRDQNRMEDARQEYEETLKTYRELAQKDPETYLPDVAAMLNDLGILDSNQNRIEEARKEFEESLKIYRKLVQKDPAAYLPSVAAMLNNLGTLDRDKGRMKEALKIYREQAQKDPATYLPYVAITRNNLGDLNSAQNLVEETRQEYEQALKIYRERHRKTRRPICLT